jgi:hypothetical protein
MQNKDKIILDLCGGTGAWSKPYRDAGYDVRVITLPDYDVCDYEPPANVYGILAAPPCTEFSVAKADNPRDFTAGMRVVDACLKIIWQCRLNGNLKFWAMENPRAFLRQFLGKPPFSFEQWQFGDMQSKPTDLWGYYNIPKTTVQTKPEGMMYRFPNGSLNGKDWMHPKCPDEYKHLNLSRAALRAITPPGFAQAFCKANQ